MRRTVIVLAGLLCIWACSRSVPPAPIVPPATPEQVTRTAGTVPGDRIPIHPNTEVDFGDKEDIVKCLLSACTWSGVGKTGHVVLYTEGWYTDSQGRKVGREATIHLDSWHVSAPDNRLIVVWPGNRIGHHRLAPGRAPASAAIWRYRYRLQAFILSSRTGQLSGRNEWVSAYHDFRI
jgi:hypothetical protein